MKEKKAKSTVPEKSRADGTFLAMVERVYWD